MMALQDWSKLLGYMSNRCQVKSVKSMNVDLMVDAEEQLLVLGAI